MRDKHLNLPLTADELAVLRVVAEKQGLPLATWARVTLLREAKAATS